MKASEIQRLENVFDQQMWCLGRDVGSPHGNLLLERGFVRHPPAKPGLSGRYVLRDEVVGVELSSVGVRFDWQGRVLTLEREPFARQLRNVDSTLLGFVGSWFSQYEQWVEKTVGASWRLEALAARSRRARFTPLEQRQVWADLSTQFDCM
jgi:hypothetical protein